MGRGLANVSLRIAQESIPSLIVVQLVLVRGLMAGIIWPLRSRDTRCVSLDRYGLYGVEPGLIVIEGHPVLFAQDKDREGVPQVHLRVPVMEDGNLYNLPNIKRYILYDGVIEQGALGCHFTHVRRRNNTRRDEVMSDLRYEGQRLGLEMDCMACAIDFLLAPAIGQDPDDLWVVRVLVSLLNGSDGT